MKKLKKSAGRLGALGLAVLITLAVGLMAADVSWRIPGGATAKWFDLGDYHAQAVYPAHYTGVWGAFQSITLSDTIYLIGMDVSDTVNFKHTETGRLGLWVNSLNLIGCLSGDTGVWQIALGVVDSDTNGAGHICWGERATFKGTGCHQFSVDQYPEGGLDLSVGTITEAGDTVATVTSTLPHLICADAEDSIDWGSSDDVYTVFSVLVNPAVGDMVLGIKETTDGSTFTAFGRYQVRLK